MKSYGKSNDEYYSWCYIQLHLKVISERVGHSNVNTTLNIYSHVLDEMDKEASNKIKGNHKANVLQYV
ncbi:TPA: hypothetical protein PC506_000571 [Clostridioides difficile]|nr:hypothetical protein [Clostridioides difficile]